MKRFSVFVFEVLKQKRERMEKEIYSGIKCYGFSKTNSNKCCQLKFRKIQKIHLHTPKSVTREIFLSYMGKKADYLQKVIIGLKYKLF